MTGFINILPYLQYNHSGTQGSIKFNLQQIKEKVSKEINGMNNLSEDLDDYFVVAPSHSQKLEEQGSHNSLFLSIARFLLYKLYFVNKFYELYLRNVVFRDIDLIDTFVFDSDISLQELLRKKLCHYWLSNIGDCNDLSRTKYK